MQRLAIGLVLLGGVWLLGRRRSSGLSSAERTFVERALDDVLGYSVHQFPLLELNIDDSPLVDDPGYQMTCEAAAPYLVSANRHLFEAINRRETGAREARVLVAQASSAAAQPGRCPFRMPELLLEGDADDEEE